MKIAMVVPGGVDRSGERRVIPALVALIKRLAERHEVHVFALSQEYKPDSWTLFGAHIYNIGRGLTHVRCWREILRLHREQPFDLAQSFFSGSCGFICTSAARLLRIPSFVHVAGGELAALPEIGYGGARTLLGRLRERWTLRRATAVTAASRAIIEQVAGVGVTARRIPLGVDLSRWPVQAPRRRASNETAQLIHVASLNRVKDQATLLHALAMLAASGVDFHLDHVGVDTLNGEVQALARELRIDEKITFHGFITHRQLLPFMARAEVHLVSSRHEAGPLVVLEAAIAGVPTIGTRVGHIAEWAPDAAVSVPVADAQKLAYAIVRILSDEDLRLRIAATAQQRALQEDADYTVSCFERLYAEMLTRQSASS